MSYYYGSARPSVDLNSINIMFYIQYVLSIYNLVLLMLFVKYVAQKFRRLEHPEKFDHLEDVELEPTVLPFKEELANFWSIILEKLCKLKDKVVKIYKVNKSILTADADSVEGQEILQTIDLELGTESIDSPQRKSTENLSKEMVQIINEVDSSLTKIINLKEQLN